MRRGPRVVYNPPSCEATAQAGLSPFLLEPPQSRRALLPYASPLFY